MRAKSAETLRTEAEPLLLSVDGGQTSTKSLVARVDGVVLGAGRGGPTVHYHAAGGVEKNRKSVQEAVATAIDDADVDPAAIVSVGLGITGVKPDGDEVPVIHGIVRDVLDPESISVETDTMTSLLGASGGNPGVVVIAGGGAIGFGIDEQGKQAVSNGLGYWLGDEGGAFWIGMRAIDLAYRASDRRGEPTALREAVLKHFDIAAMRDLPRLAYRADFRRDRISQLAPAVVQAAKSGDWAGRHILTLASRELALTAAGVMRQLFEPGANVTVYPVGGVFGERELVRKPFETEVSQIWSNAQVKNPRFPPAVGGLILAAWEIGSPIDEAWLTNVDRSMVDAPLRS